MSKSYVLDSNFIIRAAYQDNPEHKFIRKIIKTADFIIPTIVVAEVLTQINKLERKQLMSFLEISQVVELDLRLAIQAAELRKESLKKKKAYLLDCIVATVALETNSILLTNNFKDYNGFQLKLKSF